jgi:hypothetical protein
MDEPAAFMFRALFYPNKETGGCDAVFPVRYGQTYRVELSFR